MSKEHPLTITVSNPYVTCYSCSGSGLQDGLYEVTECWNCGGNGVVRDRDTKGKFVTHKETLYHVGNGEYSATPTSSPNGDRKEGDD